MKADRQRGAEGLWLRDARLGRGYTSAKQARDALERMAGHKIHYSAWAAYESGSRAISPRHREWLEELFGPIPHEEVVREDSISQLVAALDRQTAALSALVERMGRDQEQIPTWAEAVMRAVQAAGQLAPAAATPGERPESAAPPPGPGSAEP